MSENILPYIDEDKLVKELREGYSPVKNPLPGVEIEKIVDSQYIGRTPLDDMRDEDNI